MRTDVFYAYRRISTHFYTDIPIIITPSLPLILLITNTYKKVLHFKKVLYEKKVAILKKDMCIKIKHQ